MKVIHTKHFLEHIAASQLFNQKFLQDDSVTFQQTLTFLQILTFSLDSRNWVLTTSKLIKDKMLTCFPNT